MRLLYHLVIQVAHHPQAVQLFSLLLRIGEDEDGFGHGNGYFLGVYGNWLGLKRVALTVIRHYVL